MRCRVGDLCIIIASGSKPGQQNIGDLVRVVEDFGDGESWVIEATGSKPLFHFDGTTDRIGAKFDRYLQPIRYQDGEDETIKWAGKPKEDLLERCDRMIQDFNKIAAWAQEHKK